MKGKKKSKNKLSKKEIKRITHVKIHPGIGVARVGNSKDDYYIGPETKDPELVAFGGTRDKSGAIKRQAARFRVYGYDKDGEVVAEITDSDNSSIEWSVHLANKKAAWYEFNAAMDIPATVNLTVPLRNPKVTGKDRDGLVIDTGVTTIKGENESGAKYKMTGDFKATSKAKKVAVMLGELRTDEEGRLLVLPGHGISASPTDQPVFDPANVSSFNNAAGWYDDIADGPVHATVVIDDETFEAEGAWVTSAPPNFAPNVVGWRTMNDLMKDVFITAGMQSLPAEISFADHVKPILTRMTELQWVNKGFSSMFGAGAPMDFNNPDTLDKLAVAPDGPDYPDPYKELRRTIYNSFRATNTRAVEEGAWPWIYGDAFGYTDPDPSVPPSPKKYLPLPYLFDYILSKWVDGDFISEKNPTKPQKPQELEKLPLNEQPNMLDQSAVHFCLADAFHPGCELTWPMRHASMYHAPYRIRERTPGAPDPTYGSKLTTWDVARMSGPLYEQGPGDLTRWMAIPWQGDTAYCRSGYDMEYDPYLPTFWPARVPNQIFTEVDYDILCDTKKPMEVRIAAFHNRPNWLRQLPASKPAPDQMKYMIEHFGDMGVLEAKPRPKDMDWLPDVLFVENLTKAKQAELEKDYKKSAKNAPKLSAREQLLQEAGWFSEEQLNEFTTIKRRGN